MICPHWGIGCQAPLPGRVMRVATTINPIAAIMLPAATSGNITGVASPVTFGLAKSFTGCGSTLAVLAAPRLRGLIVSAYAEITFFYREDLVVNAGRSIIFCACSGLDLFPERPKGEDRIAHCGSLPDSKENADRDRADHFGVAVLHQEVKAILSLDEAGRSSAERHRSCRVRDGWTTLNI
jgi:hypothetical protein